MTAIAGLEAAYSRAPEAVRDGIPIFLRHAAIETPEDRTRLDALCAAARKKGWRDALQATYGDNPGFLQYVLDPARARFLALLPLQESSTVLEVGPGLGQFTRLMAARVSRLYALEVVEGQARFVKESCAQEGLDNVSVACGGDDCLLPYVDRAFDAIVLNLVLEWCGARDSGEAHPAAQSRLLAQIARVLKPGGMLYLATKNRYALRYLLGNRDEHAYNMRFGSALPRWLLALLLRLKGCRSPQGYLYSYRQLGQKLREAGFAEIRGYWAVPEIRYPDRIIGADAAAIREARRDPALRQGDTRSARLLMPLLPAWAVRWVMPGLIFIARK